MTRSDDYTLTIERHLGRLLSVGTWLSTASLAIGLVFALVRPEHRAAHVLLTAGLLALFATPIARVALCVLEFARQRDWWFTLYTFIVLVLLIGSVIFGSLL